MLFKNFFESENLRKEYKEEVRKLKKKYFKKAIVSYTDLCKRCNEEIKVMPKTDKDFSKDFFTSIKDNDNIDLIDLTLDHIENFDEFMEEIFSEIERLKKLTNN